ncbi:MAG: PepSY domain-containing protein [Cephaloticoccus sp.]|nr:PepSY domain-containing protein [Cephaloticoccus sp.]
MTPFHLKTLGVALLLLVGTGASGGFTGRGDGKASGDPRDFVGRAKIDAAQAIAIALKKQPGKAVEIELESEAKEGKTVVFWSVSILCDAGLMEFEVAADDGRIIEQELEKKAGELREFQEVLRHSELDLTTLIRKAEGYVKGQVVEGELEMDDGAPVAEFVFANGRCLIEVAIEARAGHLVELELKSPGASGEDDDDHEHRGGGDDDDDDGDDEHDEKHEKEQEHEGKGRD